MAVGGLVPGALEDVPDVPFGLAHVLVEQLRALDRQKTGLGDDVGVRDRLLTRGFRCACIVTRGGLGKRAGHGLRDERLTAAGRAVEQQTLRRGQVKFVVEVLMEERQFDGVPDLLDLAPEPADLGIGHIGHLFEQ